MSQNNTLSAKAQNLVDNFINKNWSKTGNNPISQTDVMKHVIITLYAQMPKAKAEKIAPFKDCIFDLHDYFTQEEITILLGECSQVIKYCLDYANEMGHIDFETTYSGSDEIIEEIVFKDSPLNIYKTPKSLIDLCERLSGKPEAGDKVLLPYADFSDYALYHPEANYHIECEDHAYGQEGELNNYVNAYAQILLDSQGINPEVVYGDCDNLSNIGIENGPNYVFTFNPTLNQKCHNALYITEGMWQRPQEVASGELARTIIVCAALAKPESCLDFTVPTSYFQAKNFWSVFDLLFKTRDMAFNATFISLPSMPFGGIYTSTCLLHIEKGKGNEGIMRFIDATGSEFKKERGITKAGHEALLNGLKGGCTESFSITNPKFYQRGGLNVNRIMEVYNQKECDTTYEKRILASEFFSLNEHVAHQYLIDEQLPDLNEGERYISLKELVEIVPGSKESEGNEIQVLGKEKLGSKYMDCDIDASSLEQKQLEVSNEYFVAPTYFSVNKNCLTAGIVEGKMKIGKLTYVEQPVAFKEGLTPFKVKSNAIAEDYLLRELAKDYCSIQAKMLMEDEDSILAPEFFLDIKIVVPSIEIQTRLVKEDAQAYLKEADRKLIQAAEEFKRDVHMKKHAIGQTLFTLAGWWDMLKKARKVGNGIVDDTMMIGKHNKTSVADIYTNIQVAIETLQNQVDHFWSSAGLEESQSIPLGSFIKAYIREHKNPLFKYEYNFDSALSNNKMPNVTFSPRALTKVFDNIINNACSHGFENQEPEGNIVKIEVGTENDTSIINISNNGKPFHKKLTNEDVFTYGRSSKTGQSHSGIGGYEVRFLMREQNGEAEFFSEPEAEFPVRYKLSFKNTDNVEY